MIVCRQERWADFIDELRPLTARHYMEVGQIGPQFECGVDWNLYETYDKAGILISVIARVDGVIRGYWGGTRFPDPHSTINGERPWLMVQALVWVEPRYRFNVALPLLREVENVARRLNVSTLTVEAVMGNRAGAFYQWLGYHKHSVSYVKLLGAATDEPSWSPQIHSADRSGGARRS